MSPGIGREEGDCIQKHRQGGQRVPGSAVTTTLPLLSQRAGLCCRWAEGWSAGHRPAVSSLHPARPQRGGPTEGRHSAQALQRGITSLLRSGLKHWPWEGPCSQRPMCPLPLALGAGQRGLWEDACADKCPFTEILAWTP